MADFTAEPAHEVNATTAGDQLHAVVCALPGGGHIVAWTTNGAGGPTVMAQVYDASGAKSGGELTLAPGFGAGGIAALPDGSFVVNLSQTSSDANGPKSAEWFQRFDMGGHALAGPVLVDGTGNYDVWVSADAAFALPGGGFALLETMMSRPTPVSTVDYSLQVFDASGAPTQSIGTGENWRAEVQPMTNGGFVIADDPYTGPGPSRPSWKAVDANGNVTASGLLQSVYGQVEYGSPTVVALASGGAAVVWSATDETAGGTTWHGQLIDAAGHSAGGVFDWSYSAGVMPRLTALAGGGFLATWATKANTPGAPFELYAQAYDATAHAAGTAEHIATLGPDSAADAGAYAITATADGGFLLDYQVAQDGQDIFEQKFDPVPVSSGGSTPGGSDELSLAGAHTQYTVASGAITGPEGTIPLTGIDRVHFGDGFALAFDIHGDAGQAYRLYQAAFDRAPDLPGLGYHINDLDHGVPLWLVAQHFIDSPEFQATYGATDNTQFITLLYQNVLHRAPDSGGLQFHMGEFAQGESRADLLTHFSESPENQANVIGQIDNGMLYVPIT